MIELLAPAGSMDALRAAVQNGANAVYLGCGAFNARQSAKNFTIQSLTEAVKYCHVRGVAVHLAVNTLVSDKETAEYETFVIDANGQIISNVLNIIADKSGGDLSYKVTYTLSSQSKFSKDEAYYVALRYKGATNELVSKTQYKIVIEFASDFDF